MHDPSGEKYGMLTVLGLTGKKYKNGDRFVSVRCECGVEKEMTYPALRRANRSCGCRQGFWTHGETGSALHNTWRGMRERCRNPKARAYKDYGARGIRVCSEWESFSQFKADMGHGFRPGLVLDRRDNSLGYFKDNCRWVTRLKSNQNMRSNVNFRVRDEILCLAELVRRHGTVEYRLAGWRYREANWPIAQAIGLDDPSITIERMIDETA